MLVLLLANGTGAVPVEEWNKTFGGANTDNAYSARETSDGGYILTGYMNTGLYGDGSADAWLIKTNANGDKIWNKTFGGVSDDYALSVQEAPNGGYIFAGSTNSSEDRKNGWVVKTDINGKEQWNNEFGGASDDEFKSIERTSDGGYILSGYTQSYNSTTLIQAWLVKIDANGNEIWNKTFGTGIYYKYNAVSARQTLDGGYIMSVNTGYPLTWLIKTDSEGNQVWTKWFKESAIEGYSIAVQQTSDGGYALAGYKREFTGTGTNVLAWLIKTDSTGDAVWNKTFGGKGVFDIVYSARQTEDGGYVLAGYTSLNNGSDEKALVIKTDANGNEIWNKTFGEASMNIIQSAEQTKDGGYIFSGSVSSDRPSNTDAWLIKLSSEAQNQEISMGKYLEERILSQNPLASRPMYYPNYTTSLPNISSRTRSLLK